MNRQTKINQEDTARYRGRGDNRITCIGLLPRLQQVF